LLPHQLPAEDWPTIRFSGRVTIPDDSLPPLLRAGERIERNLYNLLETLIAAKYPKNRQRLV